MYLTVAANETREAVETGENARLVERLRAARKVIADAARHSQYWAPANETPYQRSSPDEDAREYFGVSPRTKSLRRTNG